jgi:hypothetical protein
MRQYILITLFSVSFIFADLFPVAEGNSWEFNYINNQGGWGGGIRDSGVVTWDIISLNKSAMTTQQSLVCTSSGNSSVEIQQIIKIFRKTVHQMFNEPESLYQDSIFDPPRVYCCTLSFVGNESILVNKSNANQVIIHEVKNINTYEITQTRATYKGDSVPATLLNLMIIYNDSTEYERMDESGILLSPEIGPVEYYKKSPEDLMDVYWSEHWELIEYHIGNTGSINTLRTIKNPSVLIVKNNIIQIPLEYQRIDADISVLQLNGKCIWQKSINGEIALKMPVNSAAHSGCCIVQISSCNKPTLRVKLLRN